MGSIVDKMLENGNVINSEIHKSTEGKSLIIDGVVYLFKSSIAFIGKYGTTLEPIFVVIAICGFFLIMAGCDKWGSKLASGSVVGFILCKVCDLVWD
mgnify:CR=1 FL=1